MNELNLRIERAERPGRMVRIAAIQPPVVPGRLSDNDPAQTTKVALELTLAALNGSADLVVLPEMLNVVGLNPGEAARRANHAESFIEDFMLASQRHPGAFIVVSVLERRGPHLYNSAVVISDGRRVGQYDKTHLAIDESAWQPDLLAGSDYPVFTAPFGTFGVMTCFDGTFPEVARIYACAGADIICYPAWQSGPSEIIFDVQLRSRAVDNLVVIVRSSFGYERHIAWEPGMFFGRSSVIDRDGTVLCDVGHRVGIATTDVDLDRPILMQVADDGTNVQDLRELMFSQRRPDTYGTLIAPVPRPRAADALMADGVARAGRYRSASGAVPSATDFSATDSSATG